MHQRYKVTIIANPTQTTFMRFHVPSCQNLVVGKYLIRQFVDKLIKAQVHLKWELHVMFKKVCGTVKFKAQRPKGFSNVPTLKSDRLS